MSLNVKYTIESENVPESIAYESHTGTFWMSVKALSETLIKGPYKVFYPNVQMLEKMSAANSEEDMRKAMRDPNHFRFVVMRTEKDGTLPLYPTIIVISDNPNSAKTDPAQILAAHISVTADDINQVLATYFNDDPDAVLSDLFEYIDANNGEDVKGGVDVRVTDFRLNDNGTVRELEEEAMLAVLGTPGGDLDLIAESLMITSPGMVMLNVRDPENNALAKKSPKYDVDGDGNAVQVSGPERYAELRSIYIDQIKEWFLPRNHAGKMWDLAWKQVAEDFMVERTNTELDYNPYERDDESVKRVCMVHLTETSLSKIPLRWAARFTKEARTDEKIMDTDSNIGQLRDVMLKALDEICPDDLVSKVDIESKAHSYTLSGCFCHPDGYIKEMEVLCIQVNVHGNHVSLYDVYEDFLIENDTETPANDLKAYLEDIIEDLL